LGLQLKVGGKFHLKLNIGGRPIANKYREGKMKRTLKRELKVPEIAKREPMGGSVGGGHSCPACGVRVMPFASQAFFVASGEVPNLYHVEGVLVTFTWGVRSLSPRGVRRAPDRGKTKLRSQPGGVVGARHGGLSMLNGERC
jgi:hypothetical protein